MTQAGAGAIYGRGAWSSTGKDNRSTMYQYIVGKPLDGSTPTKSTHHEAVYHAVVAIQKKCSSLSFLNDAVDGKLGPKTAEAIKQTQAHFGLKPDGIFGPASARTFWRADLQRAAAMGKIPAAHIYGLAMAESLFDPGAVGYTSPDDHGVVQINLTWHPEVSWAQAHDPAYALPWAGAYLLNKRIEFSGKGADLQDRASILAYNSPANAKKLYETGEYPNAQAWTYVDRVLGFAAQATI